MSWTKVLNFTAMYIRWNITYVVIWLVDSRQKYCRHYVCGSCQNRSTPLLIAVRTTKKTDNREVTKQPYIKTCYKSRQPINFVIHRKEEHLVFENIEDVCCRLHSKRTKLFTAFGEELINQKNFKNYYNIAEFPILLKTMPNLNLRMERSQFPFVPRCIYGTKWLYIQSKLIDIV